MEFPLNLFQQSCMLFSCMFSKGVSLVSSFSIEFQVDAEKYTGYSHYFCGRSAASYVLLTLKCKVWAGAATLATQIPQGKLSEWIQNKLISAKFLSPLRSERIVRKSPNWSFRPLKKAVKSQLRNAVVNFSTITLSSACGHRSHQLSVNKARSDPANLSYTRKCYINRS